MPSEPAAPITDQQSETKARRKSAHKTRKARKAERDAAVFREYGPDVLGVPVPEHLRTLVSG